MHIKARIGHYDTFVIVGCKVNKGSRIMKKTAVKWLIVASATVGFTASASAQDVDMGKSEYRSSCAPCHGIDGKGDGPVSKELKMHPSDLTILAKKNNGVFPLDAVHTTIDGRDSIGSHGTREMPIWGYQFIPMTDLPHNIDLSYWKMFGPEQSSEVVVRTRILGVIDYLNRIQQK